MPTLLMDVVRLTCCLMILALAFGPLEWLFTLRERSGPRRAILVDLGYYYLNGILPALLLVLPLAAVSAVIRAAMPAAYVEALAALPLWIGIPVGLVIAELGSYLAHRWCHRHRISGSATPFIMRRSISTGWSIPGRIRSISSSRGSAP